MWGKCGGNGGYAYRDVPVSIAHPRAKWYSGKLEQNHQENFEEIIMDYNPWQT